MPMKRWLENRKHRKSEKLAASRYWEGGTSKVFHAVEERAYRIEEGQTVKVNQIGDHIHERIIGNPLIIAGMDEKHATELVKILSVQPGHGRQTDRQRAKAYKYMIDKGQIDPKPGQRLVLFPIESKGKHMPVEISAVLVDKPEK